MTQPSEAEQVPKFYPTKTGISEQLSPTEVNSKPVLQSLQCWRAYGAVAVLLYHINCSLVEIFHLKIFESTLGVGWSGVDVFFVLSGFVIYSSTDEKSRISSYLFKRFSRIYPIYWLTVFPFFVLSLLLKTKHAHDPVSLIGSCLLVFGHESYNGVSWTLSYEVYFYFLFAGVVLNRAFGYLLVVLGLFILSLALAGCKVAGPSWLSFMIDPLVLEFLAGIVAAIIYKKRLIKSRPIALCLFVLGLSYYAASGVIGLSRVGGFGVAAFILVLSSSVLEDQRKLRGGRLLALLCSLGEASYVLYLIHLPLVRVVLKGLAPWIRGSTLGLSVACAALTIGICLLSIFLHRHLEIPLLKQIRRLNSAKSPISAR
jgi:exopolysaccharide production protein ExoZ